MVSYDCPGRADITIDGAAENRGAVGRYRRLPPRSAGRFFLELRKLTGFNSVTAGFNRHILEHRLAVVAKSQTRLVSRNRGLRRDAGCELNSEGH